MELLYIKSVAIKKLTGKEIPIAQLEYHDQCEVYDVRPSVWKVARIEPMGGCLCIGCLEQRLGRRWRDFTSHPCNTMPGTERLLWRRKRLPLAHRHETIINQRLTGNPRGEVAKRKAPASRACLGFS
jgi:hypothetical protein